VTLADTIRPRVSRLRPFLPLIAVMAVAAVLRLYQLDAIDVRFDEASAPQQARDIANGMWRAAAVFVSVGDSVSV
jgi:predicted membrane-bound mannosyltransferase